MRERSQALFLIGERRPRTPASARENNVVQRNVGVRQAGGTPGHRQRPERNDGRGQVRTRTTRRRTLANWPPLASFPACFFRPWGWMVARDGTHRVRGSAVVPARPLEGHRAATDVPTTRESAPIRPLTPRRSPDPPPPRHIPSKLPSRARFQNRTMTRSISGFGSSHIRLFPRRALPHSPLLTSLLAQRGRQGIAQRLG